MTDSWVHTAPKRLAPVVLGSVAEGEDFIAPAVSLAFYGLEADKVITVTVVATEFELRKFQKDLDRAITRALRQANGER
jgi:hypothetical protein